MKWRETGVCVGAYESFLNNFKLWFVKSRSESSLDPFESELENIKSSFPADYSIVKENRLKTQVKLVDILQYAKGLGPETITAMKSAQEGEDYFHCYIEKDRP